MSCRGSATFRLIAVIEHNGSSCQSGHYVAYVRRKRFMLPVGLSSTAGAASGRPETPRSSACSPSELLKRIGLLRSFTSFACPSLRHPNCPTLAHASGSPPRGVAHESPFRQLRSVISEGDKEDGTEVSLPVFVGSRTCRMLAGAFRLGRHISATRVSSSPWLSEFLCPAVVSLR